MPNYRPAGIRGIVRQLILAPGAAPIRPNLPGIELQGFLRCATCRWTGSTVCGPSHRSAVVVGAGFIGLELVENLVRRGMNVTVVELQEQVLPPLDAEMTTPLSRNLSAMGLSLLLGQSAEALQQAGDGLEVRLKSGEHCPANWSFWAWACGRRIVWQWRRIWTLARAAAFV